MTERLELLRRYSLSGPRYTSYPTVPHWRSSPTEEQWIASLAESFQDPVALAGKLGAAIYVHIPFCESLCTYCGCNTRITRNHAAGLPYVQNVIAEWKLYQDRLRGCLPKGAKLPVADLHLGGGTPTFLSVPELEVLVDGILQDIALVPGDGFSVEADPRKTDEGQLKALFRLGFRQLSLGVQDFDPLVQERVNRIQSVEEVEALTRIAREIGFTSVNYDLIHGLPAQNPGTFAATMAAVQRLRPDRVAYYPYAHVPWIKPGQRRFTEEDLPVGEARRELYLLGRELLEASGYREIGMDHFVREGDSLWKAAQSGSLHRNFMGYTAHRASPLIGLGVSAIGDSWKCYSQNEKLLETYIARVEKGELPLLRGHLLSDEDLALRSHILELTTRFTTRWREDSPAAPVLTQVPARLADLARDRFIELGDRSCTVTENGRALLRNICMAFDAKLWSP